MTSEWNVFTAWELVHPRMTPERLGPFLPYWFLEVDPSPARAQVDRAYMFGGFQPMTGFRLGKDNALHYPGDPPMKPLAQTRLRNELIILYESDWLAIIQPDRSFEVARVD